MTYFQIWNYLISSTKINPDDFNAKLNELVKSKRIFLKDGLYSLGKVDYEKVIKRKNHAKKLLKRAEEIAKYLRQIPWVEMVAVTGSVSAFNTDETADIDVLVVTKPNRLWINRLFMVSVLKILGVYWNKQKPAGTICPNLMFTSDCMSWEKAKRNLYTANEVSLLYPTYYQHDTYFDFLKQNDWVADYLPNLLIPDVNVRGVKKSSISAKLVDTAELAAMKIQMSYMKSKKTSEVVSKDFIHFNLHDSTQEALKKFGRGESVI